MSLRAQAVNAAADATTQAQQYQAARHAAAVEQRRCQMTDFFRIQAVTLDPRPIVVRDYVSSGFGGSSEVAKAGTIQVFQVDDLEVVHDGTSTDVSPHVLSTCTRCQRQYVGAYINKARGTFQPASRTYTVLTDAEHAEQIVKNVGDAIKRSEKICVGCRLDAAGQTCPTCHRDYREERF